jgi:DNA adenine methylase
MRITGRKRAGCEPPATVPPLKWVGGKRRQVPLLRQLFRPHQHRRLVEPLCGALAVTLGLAPIRALANDRNRHLVNFLRRVQHGLAVTLPMEYSRELFNRYRDRFNVLIKAGGEGTEEAAQLFYYLNATCFNGMCRFKRKGEFNVPFGKYARVEYRLDFAEYVPALANVTFTAGDFEVVILEPADFVYADPPFDVPFTHYVEGGFGWADQVRLATWLARHTGPVVLANQATDRIVGLYADLGYEMRFFDAPRAIACNGDRTPAREVLAFRGL